MDKKEIEQLRSLTRFEDLVAYLRDELDWPIDFEDARDIDRLTFDYEPEELGLDPKHAVKIDTIKQIRPMADTQPWGIFYIEFEAKRLPVTVLRRVLRALVPTARKHNTDRKTWDMDDLLFISHQGEPDKRSISFAHFHQKEKGLPELRTFSWDTTENHFQYIQNLNLESLRWPENEEDPNSWQKQWDKAFTLEHRYVIRTAQALAEAMAKHAKTIRDLVNEVYFLEAKDGPLHDLYKSFKTVLIHDLNVDDFADMYAQTVTYGLFTARATQSGEFAIENVAAMIPNTNPFLRELLEELTTQECMDLDELGVGQLVDLLKNINIEAILQDFGRQMRGHDPVIHFYETFLKEYDAEKKVERGVFYTPDPVVSFIVRSVDEILKTEFGLNDGVADYRTMEWKGKQVPKIQILDPATGTGTFLKYVIQVVWDTFHQKHKNISSEKRLEMWNQYVENNLLPRIYGFELMMAPYSVAHMKLGLFLKELGYKFESDKRLGVYLTNTLQPVHEIPRTDTLSLAHEADEANQVKTDYPIMVIIGNPPYSNFGKMNKGDWITNLIDDYKEGLNEKKINLDDDFIKFIRFAQWRIDQTGKGIVAFITNNVYLDGITHRSMRESLLSSFDQIYIINLHGNSRIGELSPDGSKDENVFDIQQGVGIAFFIKNPSDKKHAKVHYIDIWGSREKKYEYLLTSNFDNMDWNIVKPSPPYFFFTPKDFQIQEEYKKYIPITSLFTNYVTGIDTKIDRLLTDNDPNELAKRVQSILDPNKSVDDIKRIYNIPKRSTWEIERAKTAKFDSRKIVKMLYRPFDIVYTYFDKKVLSRARESVMSHFIEGENLGLCFMRQFAYESEYNYFFVTKNVAESRVFISNRGRAQVLVLYNYIHKNNNGIQKNLFPINKGNEVNKTPNLNKEIIEKLKNMYKLDFIYEGSGDLLNNFGPEDIFSYVYSIFHSNIYRTRFLEWLKIEFPRIPLTSQKDLFTVLCGFGKDLINLHLLEENCKLINKNTQEITYPFQESAIRFIARNNKNEIGSVNKTNCFQNNRVFIDTSQLDSSSYFDGVSEKAWNFGIGGYQVLHKWLYDRRSKGKQPRYTLTKEDITHYKNMVVAIQETVRIMDEIDGVIEDYGGWPIQ